MENVMVKCMRRDFGERLSSLLKDGYCCRVKGETPECMFARLRHMANGNEIRLRGYKKRGVLEQETNHIVTYQASYATAPEC